MLDRQHRRRRRVARALERVSVPERRYVGRGPRYLIRPELSLACAPSLRTVAAALRDEQRQIDDRYVVEAEAFVTSFDSPLRANDPEAARAAAAALEQLVTGATVSTKPYEQALAA